MRQLKIVKQITSRETQSLDKYLQEVGRVPLVTVEEEVELTRRIREGDQAALEKLTKANLRFVISVAKQYQNYGLSLGDLINEGNVGLIKAAMRFDETRGFKFISYAVWWIRQAIMQSLAEQARIVRLPLNRVATIGKISKTFSALEQSFQREPSTVELADAMGLSPQEVMSNQKNIPRHISVDAPLDENTTNSLLDVLTNAEDSAPDSFLMSSSLKIDIQRALSMLTMRESEIVTHYYGLSGTAALTLEELGQKLDLTPERVRQIKEKAMYKLKVSSKCTRLKTYLR